ncbi:TPA: hypothetical protein JJA66_003800 [Serratia marcescens]|nr:hypothetical protein [Serratia marcescens]
MSESDSIEEVPSSVPANTKIVMMGFSEHDDFTAKFGEAIKNVIVVCGRYIDLSLLDGVTVGVDYEVALQSVNLGYESSVAKGYTNTDDLIGVAKVIRVKREGMIKAHVVYNANVLTRLIDHTHPEWLATLNIVAHELGHVSVIAWFEKHSPGIMLEPFKGDWLRGQLLDAAHTCWEEYAACKLASIFNHPIVEEGYLEMATSHVKDAFTTAHEIIKEYRTKRDLNSAVNGVAIAVSNPIKYISYYLGHLDGIQKREGDSVDAEQFGVYSPFIIAIQDELQKAWDTRKNWDGLNGLNGLLDVMLKIFSSAGMDINLDYSEHGGASYVNFPYTPQTLPGGEVEYQLMKLRGLI